MMKRIQMKQIHLLISYTKSSSVNYHPVLTKEFVFMGNLDASINNTPYSEEELKHFKELLLQKRKEAEEKVEIQKDRADDVGSNDGDEYSSVDHHPGNIGSEEEEKEVAYTLIEREKDRIKKINAALDRIGNKTYGVCQETGKKIQKERLETIPYAQYSMEARKGDDNINQPPRAF